VLNGRSLDTVTAALRAANPGGQETVLIISADAAASHQSVVLVMEAARKADLSRITFATQSTSSGKR
jgi:biopolymer transport protein ExbD